MPATVIQQIPLRLQVSTASAPSVSPIDYNTGLAPAAWRAQTLSVQLGVFDADGNAVDLTDLAYIQLLIQEAPESTVPLVVKQVDAVDIDDTITVGGWRDGSEQNASFDLSAAELDFNLLAARSRDLWLAIVGYTDEDAPIVLGAGPLTVSLASASLPATAPRYTSRHAQESDAGDITVTPNSAVHTEVITIGGAARDVKCILGTNGVRDGAKLFVTVNLPATPDITVSFRSGLGTNPQISTLTTGSVLKALLQYYYDADAAAWVPEFYALPPT